MINWLHSQWHRPEQGWDPVDPDWAQTYAAAEWQTVDTGLLDRIETRLGGLAGKRVLDMGAGAGQYSVALAQRGAEVVWYDISRTYQTIAQRQAAEAGLTLEWHLGYFEDAPRYLPNRQFDFIFNRICWYYCQNDRAFARLLWSLLAQDGLLYIHAPNSRFHAEMPALARLRTWLNARTGFKVGHPMLPPRQLASLLNTLPLRQLEADCSDPCNDVLWVRK